MPVPGLGARYPPTGLIGGTWLLPTAGEVRCVKPDQTLASLADERWPSGRRPDDVHNWSWRKILGEAHDIFCVASAFETPRPVALWCSTAPRLLRLAGGPAYRLDCIEVAPEARGAEVGVFTLGLVAARALECGAKKLVLGALPQAVKLYDRTGGQKVVSKGWRVARGLLPYEFAEATLVELKEAANELRQN
jgi:hypothetical protein